jgi:eukaryotic-like serine/threonine-protein kinase
VTDPVRTPPPPLPHVRLGSGSKVRASNRRTLTLGKLVKSGGAGSIFALEESSTEVAKIYHEHVDRDGYQRKVEAMLELRPDLPDLVEAGQTEVQIAWPEAALRDGAGRFRGFAMPLIDLASSVELEYVLQERQALAAGLPTGLGAKMALAANLAALLAELHRLEHFIVDLKPINLRFYRRSFHVTILDCDGFSIRGRGERFPAPQVTPEYLAPEFQTSDIPAGAEEAQDRFALATVLFQLLNFGIHPFSGRPLDDDLPTDIPGRIRERCWAYGTRPNPAMQPNPTSGHSVMPQELRVLFDRAFESEGVARPRAREWAELLKRFARRSTGLLVQCRADPTHQHFAAMECAACARLRVLQFVQSPVLPPLGSPPPPPPPPPPEALGVAPATPNSGWGCGCGFYLWVIFLGLLIAIALCMASGTRC